MWELNEILHENHTGQSLVHSRHVINISYNYYNYYYSMSGHGIRINPFLKEKKNNFDFPEEMYNNNTAFPA